MVNLWATYRLLRSLEKSMEFPRTRGVILRCDFRGQAGEGFPRTRGGNPGDDYRLTSVYVTNRS